MHGDLQVTCLSASSGTPVAPGWLTALGLIETPERVPLVGDASLRIWNVALDFAPWLLGVHGPLETPRDTYRRTPLRTAAGALTIAEVELVDRLRLAGWHAGWLDSFGGAPECWRARVWDDTDLPDATHALFAAIAESVGNRWRGRPDIVAWRDGAPDEVVYLHYKGSRDPVRPSQQDWVRAAFAAGLPAERYALARWWG